MAKTIESLFYYLHYATDILIILLFLIFSAKIKGQRSLALIALYALSDLVLNVLSYYYKIDLGQYVWSTFTFFEYGIFTYIIWLNIKKRKFRRLMVVLSVFFVVFSTIYNIVTNFKNYDSIPIGIETILILVFAFYYLYEQMNDTNTLFIYNTYQFWLVIGFMIYLSGSFFVFIFANYATKKVVNQYWFLTNVFYSMMNILFAISLLVFAKKNKKVTKKHNFQPYLN